MFIKVLKILLISRSHNAFDLKQQYFQHSNLLAVILSTKVLINDNIKALKICHKIIINKCLEIKFKALKSRMRITSSYLRRLMSLENS